MLDIPKIIKDNSQRVTTGLAIAAVVVVIAVLNNFYLIWAFLGAIFMFSFHEAMKLFKVEYNSLYVYALVLWIVALFFPSPIELFFLVAVIMASVLAYKKDVDKKLFLPFLYPTISFLFLLVLYTDYGIGALVWLIVAVAATDVGAYFVGKSMGKTPFSASSPNKTLEGVFGGAVLATALATFAGSFVVNSVFVAFLISVSISFVSIFGDLFESYLKREAGVKDSGKLLPGHGGMLDRVDGYLFAVVIMVVLLRGAV